MTDEPLKRWCPPAAPTLHRVTTQKRETWKYEPILEHEGATFLRNVGILTLHTTQCNIPEGQKPRHKRCGNVKSRNHADFLCQKSKKLKWSRYRPGVAQRVGTGIALLFHDCGTRRGWVVSSRPRPYFTPVKDPVPILQGAGWTPGPVSTSGKFRPHRDSIPDRPARSQSLYRLSYRAHDFLCHQWIIQEETWEI